ncbi:MAG: hypothetical protein WCQ72_06870 [Eubacteriales bacterium]
MMKKKALTAAASLLLCALLLASCGAAGGGTTAVTTAGMSGETSAVTEADEYKYPDADYGGHTFLILNQDECDWANMLIAPDESNGELINDALYNRNVRIEEKFNVKIKEQRVPYDDIKKITKNVVTAGDDTYDMIPFPLNEMGALITENYFVDLLSVDSLNLTEPWWDQTVIGDATMNGKCYLASSDISFFPFEATWVIYFNRGILDNLGLDVPYDLVRDGKWTLDRLIEYTAAASDINSDDSFKYDAVSGTAQYGMLSHDQLMNVMLFGADEKLVSFDDGSPVYTGNTDRFYSVCSKITQLTAPDGQYIDRTLVKLATPTNNSVLEFKNNRFLFVSETLGHIKDLRDFESEFGVLPMPKYEETQDAYYSMIATWGTLLTTIPVTNGDTERTGVILDVLAYDSYKTLMEPYYETYLTQKGARDEDSAEMLRIIRDSRTLNVGVLFNWTSDVLTKLDAALCKGNSDVASIVEKQLAKIESNMEKSMELFNS